MACTIHGWRRRYPPVKQLYVSKLTTFPKPIDFIVPDDRVAAGLEALSQLESLTPCPDEKGCPSISPARGTPIPAGHSHVRTSEVAVGLYPQADLL